MNLTETCQGLITVVGQSCRTILYIGLLSVYVVYTITLCNFVVPTCSVLKVILLLGDGCGSPNHI